MKNLTNRQLATTLAALRHWQRTTTFSERARTNLALPEQIFFEDATPLKDAEIDRLCEQLNVAENTK